MLEVCRILKGATGSLLEMMGSPRPDRAMAVAVPYLKLCGYVAGGWLMARASAIAAKHKDGADREFYSAKLRTALFYAEQVLPVTIGLSPHRDERRQQCCGYRRRVGVKVRSVAAVSDGGGVFGRLPVRSVL